MPTAIREWTRNASDADKGVTIGKIDFDAHPFSWHAEKLRELTPEQQESYLRTWVLGAYSTGHDLGVKHGKRSAQLRHAQLWRIIDEARAAVDEE